jgi:hypothetical protein
MLALLAAWFVAPAAVADDLETSLPQLTAEARAHWAFQPVVQPAIPHVKATGRVRTPVDAFLLQRLEAKELSFGRPADKPALIRRAKFDLTGLPPTPAEIEEFLSDDAPDAYERLIDRLLASPHYGEAWGRDWLDLVRFAAFRSGADCR